MASIEKEIGKNAERQRQGIHTHTYTHRHTHRHGSAERQILTDIQFYILVTVLSLNLMTLKILSTIDHIF